MISWEGQGDSHYQMAFSYTGTRSYAQYLAMSDALAFRTWLGGDAVVMDYIHTLAVQAGAAMASVFGTDVLSSDASLYGSMVRHCTARDGTARHGMA